MPVNDILTPQEAAYIATNSYFTLKDWISGAPKVGMESHANVKNRVLGAADAGNMQNTSLKGTDLGSANLKRVFAGTTGMGTNTGFGYLLKFQKGDRRHAVIATRGTRPELGAPDLLTDARAAMTSFGDFGLVHKGFKTTFDSVIANIARDNSSIMDADVVHCVGHSLGGAVATLMAAHYARLGKSVKLYTFGSPRVGAFSAHSSLEKMLGKNNIFRTAHDLDPITLIGPYPYIHVNPAPSDQNNFTLPSPTGSLFSTANHDMALYINSVAANGVDATWEEVRSLADQCDHENSVLAKWLLHKDNNPGWVQYASAKTLGLLFKLFAHVLKTTSTSIILGLTAVDLLAEMIHNGLCKLGLYATQIFSLLRHAAAWAGLKMAAGADFTAGIIKIIFNKMMSTLTAMAAHAVVMRNSGMMPLPLIIAGGWTLVSGSAY